MRAMKFEFFGVQVQRLAIELKREFEADTTATGHGDPAGVMSVGGCMAFMKDQVATLCEQLEARRWEVSADSGFVRKAKRNYGMRNYGRNYA
eukprot:COSAG05_NODE_1468_length_4793_cov_6.365069_5_plen_92_part_00